MTLSALYQNLFGRELPSLVSPVDKSSFVDFMTGLGTSEAPDAFFFDDSPDGDFDLDPDLDIDFDFGMVAESPMRRYLKIVEFQQNPGLAGPKNVEFKDATQSAKEQFISDYQTAVSRTRSLGIERVVTGGKVVFGDISDAGELVAAYYNPKNDTIAVSANYGFDLQTRSYLRPFLHEAGHRFHVRCGNAIPPNSQFTFDHVLSAFFEAIKNSDDPKLKPSDYGMTKAVEFWAECFTIFVRGGFGERPALKEFTAEMINTYKSVANL